jgi:dTMP kinase
VLDPTQIPAELWRFPDRSLASGALINDYLQSKASLPDQAVHLLFSANRWEKRSALIGKLAEGVTLLCDRYAHSGVAYSAAKAVPGMDLQVGRNRWGGKALFSLGGG